MKKYESETSIITTNRLQQSTIDQSLEINASILLKNENYK